MFPRLRCDIVADERVFTTNLWGGIMKKGYIKHALYCMLVMGISVTASSSPYFVADFESPDLSHVDSKWSWRSPYESGVQSSGMMFGEGDIYSRTGITRIGGQYALKLSFDGRNGFCNTCGGVSHELTNEDLASQCVPVSSSAWDGRIFNTSKGYATTKIVSSTSSEVCFNSNNVDSTSMSTDKSFSAGDKLYVPHQCDVNGNVAGNVSRRLDCNEAINYLDGIESTDFGYGETLSRRIFFYIPSETTMPTATLKLGYADFNVNQADGSTKRSGTAVVLSVSRNLQLEVGGSLLGGHKFTDFIAPRDQWVYIEEVWERESIAGSSDGRYRLFVGVAARGDAEVVLEVGDLGIGSINRMSVIGNWQHTEDATGSVYIDSVVIDKKVIGMRSAPKPPTGIDITSGD